MAILELFFNSGQHGLEVRRFKVVEGMSRLFQASIVARSPQEDIDLDAIVGKSAMFRIVSGLNFALTGMRSWSGTCSAMEQTRVEPSGLSTYEISIVPTMWLLTQRRNNRLFQHVDIPTIVDRVLTEWSIEPVWKVDRARYPRLELRVQYGESDFAFLSRLLEEAGIAFYFVDDLEKGTRLVLHDRPHENEARPGGPLPFVDQTFQAQAAEREYVSAMHVGHEVRPGRFTIRDFDFRNPRFPLFGDNLAAPAPPSEDGYEQYHYQPGAALVEAPVGGSADAGRVSRALAEAARAGATPTADDKGVARFDQERANRSATTLAESRRASRRAVHFETNALDLSPGVVFSLWNHPRTDLRIGTRLLVDTFSIEGAPGEEWRMAGAARFADLPYRPPMMTPRPTMQGVQSAVVVGPAGEEIYTDEFGRVRVQFHWDREGKLDDESSIWMRVSQGWAGGGYGMFTIPRVGHEVLVTFLDGDPDCPIIVGRVFNGLSTVPHKLPENKTVSTWKSDSSPSTGGFNELRFDDAAGREMVYEQAERDRKRLVKNDEQCAVGGNRTRSVRRNESIGVGGSRTQTVALNELRTTGVTRTEVVGVNRQSFIGGEDSTVVGSKFSVTVARGMTARLSKRLESVLQGPLGAIFRGPAGALLGLVPATALGAVGGMTEQVLNLLDTHAPEALLGLLGLEGGMPLEDGPPPTSFEIRDRTIVLSTGEASITLQGPDILLHANRNIVLQAMEDCAVLADGEAAIAAFKKVLVLSRNDDVIVQAGNKVHLNPTQLEPDPRPAHLEAEFHPKGDTCDECGAVLVVDEETGAWICQNLKKRRENIARANERIESALAAEEPS